MLRHFFCKVKSSLKTSIQFLEMIAEKICYFLDNGNTKGICTISWNTGCCRRRSLVRSIWNRPKITTTRFNYLHQDIAPLNILQVLLYWTIQVYRPEHFEPNCSHFISAALEIYAGINYRLIWCSSYCNPCPGVFRLLRSYYDG